MMEPWTSEEDAIVIQQFHRIGPKWVEIGKMLSGRSGNNVKNRWHKHLSRLEAAYVGPQPRPEIVTPVVIPEKAEEVPAEPGLPELIWPTLFSSVESGDRTWNGGFSIEDSLY
jgi:hypothetical protein